MVNGFYYPPLDPVTAMLDHGAGIIGLRGHGGERMHKCGGIQMFELVFVGGRWV